jgi:phospholipid transport system substrate-binding protein
MVLGIEATMSIKHAFRRHCLALLLGVIATFGTVSASPAATAPEAYVKTLADQAIAILTDTSLDQRARHDAFRVLIVANTDLDRIANFALGRYASQMRAANRYDEYVSLFREYIVRIYAARLGGYSGEQLTVSRSVPRGTDEVIVFSSIQPGRSGGSPIALNWRLRETDGGYKVADVQIAGAWMSIEQQDQFTSIITNNNRETTKLLDFLRQQLASAARNGSPS